MTKQQIEEKLTAVSVLRNSPGVDQGVMHDIEDLLSLVMKQCGARERKLQTSLQLVLFLLHILYRPVYRRTAVA